MLSATVNARTVLLAMTLWCMAGMSAHAMPAINCHCFTDRSYDAAKPAAADAYLLATTQNTFFASVFNVEKKSTVMMKQQGVPGEDLWVAYWIASRSASDPDSLLGERTSGHSWQDILKPMQLPSDTLGMHFSRALAAKGTAVQLAEAVVDELIAKYQLLEPVVANDLRQLGASNQELLIATAVSGKSGHPARQALLDARSGARTWGAQLLAVGIDAKSLQHEIERQLKQHSLL